MKQNLILKTAVASTLLAAASIAAAGAITATARNVAFEAFGSAVTAATQVDAPDFNYQFSTPGGIVINPGGSIIVTFAATGAKFDTTVAAPTGANLVVPAGTGGTLTAAAAWVNGNLVVTLSNDVAALTNSVIGVGGLLQVKGVKLVDALGLANGTSVQLTGRVDVSAGGANLEPLTAAVPVVTSSQAVSITAASSSTFNPAETKRINLSTTPTAGSALVTTALTNASDLAAANVVNFGSVTFSNNAPAALQLTGATAVNVASASFTDNALITLGKASGSFTAGMAFTLNSNPDCTTAGSVFASTPVPAAILANTATVELTTTARPVAATAYHICGTFPTGVNAVAISPIQPSVAATLVKASTSYKDVSLAATNLYSLTTNGKQVDVKTYVPAAEQNGYTSYIRIVNSGSVPATVSGAFIAENGVVGTSSPLITNMAAGASKTLAASDVEAAIGAATANTRPRVRITAPTDDLEVQSFLLQPGGAFVEVSGKE